MNRREILKTLKLTTEILLRCGSDYRILGSTVTAAFMGNMYREVADIDVVLDSDSLNCVLENLRDNEFDVKTINAFGVNLYSCTKKSFSEISIMASGIFDNKFFTVPLGYGFSVKIESKHIQSTKYKLFDTEFIGTPIELIVAGVKRTHFKPSRKKDQEALSKRIDCGKIKDKDLMNFYFYKLKLPFVYDLFLTLRNFYGLFRLAIGKPYELVR